VGKDVRSDHDVTNINRGHNQENFHWPCRFRAVSAALHGTSRVRSHLPQANYIKLR